MNRPKVSIIIPSYNASKYISDTVQSLIDQSFTNWELIIVDDGSRDNSKEIISKFSETDSRIKYFFQENAGVSAARNHGIKRASGKYITFLDADDYLLSHNLQRKVDLLDADETIDWVFSDVELTDENLNVLDSEAGLDQDIFERFLLWEQTVVTVPCSNIILRRKCVDDGLCFDTNLSTAADQDFCFYLAQKYTGKRINECLVRYRIVPGSMSQNIALMEKDHVYVYRKAKRNGLFKDWYFKQRCFSNLYMILAGSWIVDGGNRWRGFYFFCKSLLCYPPTIFKIAKKYFSPQQMGSVSNFSKTKQKIISMQER